MSSIRDLIRTIPDHPKPGIQFRDITTLLLDPRGLREVVDGFAGPYSTEEGGRLDFVAGIEARGFIFGAPLAHHLDLPFVLLRKPGKLPGETVGRDFELEYGTDRIELHVDAVQPGQRGLLVDDLIATGGTAEAALLLLRAIGAEVAECAFVVALPALAGIERIEKHDCPVRWLVDFEGD